MAMLPNTPQIWPRVPRLYELHPALLQFIFSKNGLYLLEFEHFVRVEQSNKAAFMDIRLITVVAEYTNALPYMLSHYAELGVRETFIHTRTDAGTAGDLDYFRIVKTAEQTGAIIASRTIGAWSLALNQAFFATSRLKSPNDWFLLADPDELQVYPDDILQIISYCDKKGYDYVEGCFIDRLGAEGGIVAIDPALPSIWKQCPLAGFVTGPICGGVTSKIVAAKGHVRVSGGQHATYTGKGCPVSDIYVPVHHFKWIDNILAILDRRSQPAMGNDGRYGNECKRFLDYYKAKGRVNINDPDLHIATCERNYPHWEKIRKMRISASLFSPFITGILN